MTAVVTGENNLIEARKICEGQDKLVLAVSYWGKGAVEFLKLPCRENVHIVLNVTHGGTNPQELETLMERFPGRVRVHPTLHAKIYANPRLALIGSANASSNGLQGGHAEAGVVLSEEAAERAFILAQKFFEAGQVATQEDVATCKARFGRGTIGETMQPKAPQKSSTVLGMIHHRQELFGAMPILLTDSTVSDDVIQEDYTLQQQAGAPDLQGDYDENIWDYFSWPLNERYLGRDCLAIHRPKTNGDFSLYFVRPLNHVPANSKGTFAYLLKWPDILAAEQGRGNRQETICKRTQRKDWEKLNKAFEALNADFECDWSGWYKTGWDLYDNLLVGSNARH